MTNAVTINFGSLAPFFKPHIKNLGVAFDSGLKFDKQISSVVRTSFFQLRLLAKVKPFLFLNVIHTFISSRLDCNTFYFGLSQSSISRLHLVQNAAAQF